MDIQYLRVCDMESQKFCGSWTEEKLDRLKKYLNAYTEFRGQYTYL